MKKLYLLLVIVLIISLPSCTKKQLPTQTSETGVDELVSWMEGSYNSYLQSSRDTNYFNISLEMHRIWTKRTDGYWLYVEQAMGSNLYKPYRQRVYHVYQQKKQFVSEVYELKQPEKWIRQYKTPAVFDQISPDSLLLRSGCEVIIHKEGNVYVGATGIGTCESTLRGAKYATSKVTIRNDRLESWDQGFDQQNKQVWGATNGPYIFIKQPPMKPLSYPNAPQGYTIDNYHGTTIADPYRWLEDENSPQTKEWINAQNMLVSSYLNDIPFRFNIEQRLANLYNFERYSLPFRKNKQIFFLKNDGLQNHNVLYQQDSINTKPSVLIDPNALAADGSISLTNTSVSANGKYMQYGMSVGGSDWNTFKIVDIAARKDLPDELKNIKFSGAAWFGNGFFYTRYDAPEAGKELSSSNKSAKIYYHNLNTPQTNDVLVYQDTLNAKRSFNISTTDDEKIALLYISEAATENWMLYYAPTNEWQKGFLPIINDFESTNHVIDHLGNNKLLVLTNRNAPRYRLVEIDLAKPAPENWREIIAQPTNEVIESVEMVSGLLLVKMMKDVTSRLYLYDLIGKKAAEIELPGLGYVSGTEASKDSDVLFYTYESFMYPPTVFKYDLKIGKSEVFRQPKINFNFDDYETKQVFYPSKDGTQIPMFITARKGTKQTGYNPTLLYGYGGFNIARIPEFKVENLPFYENGGVYAVASLRGGSEYGEEWHEAGMLDKKQTVFDDCIAAAEYLIAQKYTKPERLALTGRSNGGLLVGAVLNQRPELFKAAIPVVGVMDMLRFQKFTIGWAWTSEYGSSDNFEEFKYLRQYSPYHNISPNKPYPAMLIRTAERDDRVVPAHSYKYAAALQNAYKGSNPILIRIEQQAGHGSGKSVSQTIYTYSEWWSFLFKQLEMFPK